VSRLHFMIVHPRRTLAVLATTTVAVGVTLASSASFTATSANPSNTFTAGTLTMANSKSGAAILTAANMRPADPATTGTVDIQNTGSLSGAFVLARTAPVDSDGTFPMSAKLNAIVTDCGAWTSGGTVANPCGDGDDVVKYTGLLSAMPASTALGTFAATDKHTYKFSVALDTTADNNYQGDSSTVRFDWNAS
jgi:spore coat-associated protein N